jgi:nicotinamide-nucleotide amidase
MKAEIITIGDEILIGQTIDTNSAWIGSELSRLGFDVFRKIAVHDDKNSILDELSEISGKADLVIITGGLGPTSDDITKPVLCEFFNSRLVVNCEVLEMIGEMVKRRGFTMNDNNRKQAEVPDSCKVLKNSAGTAPGMWFEKDGTIYISIPGVPHEMKHIMNEHVIPALRSRFTSQIIIHRNIMTYGVPEAMLAELLTGFESELPPEIKLAYLPSLGIIKLRLTAKGKNFAHLENLIEAEIKKLYEIIPDLIFGENEVTFESEIGKLLAQRGETISTAESCTGGRIACMLTSVAGSSRYFKGSVIAYDNRIKTDILGVTPSLIADYGAVSREVVEKMAEGARSLLKTDYSVAVSGIAGPDGGTGSKPVGTLWLAVTSEKGTISERHQYGNDRITNIDRFAIAALNLVRKQIISQ